MSSAPFDDSLALPEDSAAGSSISRSSASYSAPAATATQAIMLGKFRLIAQLGKGSMGKVLRAEDTKLKRHVALKCLKKEKSGATYRSEQFIREARSAATLEHPSIVQIYEVGEASGYHYIAMELIEGGSLGALIKACGPLDITRACQLSAEAAEALAFAAQLGITHRDIKPENLMLTRNGRCKISDFGLCKIEDPADNFNMPAGIVGTPNYMAPEIIQALPATAKSDVYSLACVIYFLLTGRPPFHAKDRAQILQAQLHAPPPDITTLRPDLPQSLSKVLSRALAKNPDDRPTPDTFAKQLRAHTIPVNGSSDSLHSSVFIPQQLPIKKSRALLYSTAAVITAIAAASITFFIINSNKPQPAAAASAVPVIEQPAATPAPAPTPAPVAIAPTPIAAPAPALVAVPTPAPVVVAEKPAVSASKASTAIHVADNAAILAAIKANQKITILATAATVKIDSAEKLATVSFADNPDFTITYNARIYSTMTKKFGGKDGNGIVNRPLLFTGYPTLTSNKPQLLITSASQIDIP